MGWGVVMVCVCVCVGKWGEGGGGVGWIHVEYRLSYQGQTFPVTSML